MVFLFVEDLRQMMHQLSNIFIINIKELKNTSKTNQVQDISSRDGTLNATDFYELNVC